MKKLFILYMLLAYSYSCFAANIHDVPEQAKEAFKKQYPCALYAKWEALEGSTVFEVRFVYDNRSMVAYYDEDGSAMGFATTVTLDKLPAGVKEVLAARFAGCQTLSMWELELPDQHLFCFEVSRLEEKLFIAIDSHGRIQKKKRLRRH